MLMDFLDSPKLAGYVALISFIRNGEKGYARAEVKIMSKKAFDL
jgi:hypothetical protein